MVVDFQQGKQTNGEYLLERERRKPTKKTWIQNEPGIQIS
jgi:hypothetical protein